MSTEKENPFLGTDFLDSLRHRAAWLQPAEEILELKIVRSRGDQAPKVSSLPVPAVSRPGPTLFRGVTFYSREQLRANDQETRATSVIGRDIATGELCSISDMDRRTGLYILGISGMGKSWLLVNLILQDIKRGHGLLFIDPHGNAIDDLLDRVCLGSDSRYKECLLFNPEDERGSFGINLLRCENIGSLNARQDTYTRAKGVFDKIWKTAYNEVPWLQEILQYTLYAFIENQNNTLADVPRFLTNRAFREHIVNNIRYNLQAADFWRDRFEPKRAAAALTRVDALLGDPYVHDIVAQRETTIDFTKFIDEKRVVLFRLSDRLSTDVKTFIGTILVSELVGAVKRRSTENPHQFCVYVDECQNFASYEDFSTLITGGRKYGVATTIAHQERVGQFAKDRTILGATDAAGNKICFQLSAGDAKECAGVFAEAPPMETKREEELVIIPHPVDHLLNRGHKDPKIREFVNKYLRQMQYKREDTKENMEEERLKRLMYLDQAGIYAADERIETLETNDDYVRGEYLDARRAALVRAQGQTGALLNLFDISKNLRLTMRGLNSFLNAIMEKRISCREEAFSDFLISLVRGYSKVPEEYVPTATLYISLLYGDHTHTRLIPYEFARSHGVFFTEVSLLKDQYQRKTKEERRKFYDRRLQAACESLEGKKNNETWRAKRALELKREIIRILVCRHTRRFDEDQMYQCFVWMECFSTLAKLIRPFYTARFDMDGRFQDITDSRITKFSSAYQEKARHQYTYKEKVVRNLIRFLQTYGEGALVTFDLLDAGRLGSWKPRERMGYYEKLRLLDTFKDHRYLAGAAGDLKIGSRVSTIEYENTCMTDFPRISGTEPLDVLRLVKNINDFMRLHINDGKLDSYYQHGRPEEFTLGALDMDASRVRGEVKACKDLLQERWRAFAGKWPAAARLWERYDGLTRSYVLTRACDLFYLGEEVADLTFPKCQDEEAVSALVGLLEEREAEAALAKERKEKEEEARELERIEKECGQEVAAISFSPPALLEARVLNESERQKLIMACEEEFSHSESVKGILEVVSQFVNFCTLLSRAENHILVQSGQYIVKEVPARFEHDVVNQKARELMELPKYTAYAKMHQEAEGRQTVWKGTIQTLELAPGPGDVLTREVVKSRRAVIDVQSTKYLKWRDRIAEEITKRQEGWRAKVVDRPPGMQSESKTGTVNITKWWEWAPVRSMFENMLEVPKEPVVVPEDEPPPSHS